MILIFPFIIELIADWQLIKAGKKDIPLWLRVVLIGLCSTETFWVLTIPVSNLCLAWAPFCLFDPLLNKLRGKKWSYVSTTNGKAWEKFMARFNPYALMVFRCVGFGVLVAGYFLLKKYGI